MSDSQSARQGRDVLIFATLTGLLAFIPVSTDLLLPAIPAMTEELDASIPEGQLTLSLFMFGVAFGQLLFGPLSDRLGRLPVVRAGCLSLIVASLLISLAPNIEYVWLGRILQGAAAASGAVVARAIIRDLYEGNRAAQIMSLTSASMASVPLLAPTLGAYLTVHFSWRLTVVAQAFFAAIVFIGLSQMRETAPKGNADQQNRLSLRHIATSFGDCLRNPLFIGYQMSGTFSFCAIFIYISTVAFFLSDVFAISTQYFGLVFGINAGGYIAGSLVSARLVQRWGQDKTLSLGTYICAATSATALALMMDVESLATVFALVSIMFFFGVGLISPNASMGAVSLYPHKAGAASAVYGSVHSVSSAGIGIIAGVTYSGGLFEPVLLIFLCTIGALAGTRIIHRYRTQIL